MQRLMYGMWGKACANVLLWAAVHIKGPCNYHICTCRAKLTKTFSPHWLSTRLNGATQGISCGCWLRKLSLAQGPGCGCSGPRPVFTLLTVASQKYVQHLATRTQHTHTASEVPQHTFMCALILAHAVHPL